MTLSEYMKASALDDERMAAAIGCSPGAVKKWRYRERTPRPEQLRRIAEITGGQVQPNDFVVSPPVIAPAEAPVVEAAE